MLIAVPLTICSARSVIEKKACTNAIAPPAAIPISRPRNHEPVMSAPKIPKKAPVSIMPSRAMFTTPERSDTMPPSAPKVSGVAQRRRDQCRPGDDVAEVPDARLRRRDGARAADEPGRDRPPAEALLAAPHRPPPRRHGREAEQDRRDRRVDQRRR